MTAATPPAPLLALVTPCHGAPLNISTVWESSGYDTYAVVDGINCPADGCANEWSPDGIVVQETLIP